MLSTSHCSTCQVFSVCHVGNSCYLVMAPAVNALVSIFMFSLMATDFKESELCCLHAKPHLGPKTRFLLLSDRCVFVYAGYPLWQDDCPDVYNCCCLLPVQLFLGSVETHIEDSPNWEPSPCICIPRHWVPFLSPLMTHKGMVKYSNPNQSRSHSHVMAVGNLATQSWCLAISGAQDQIYVTVRHLLLNWCRAPSLTRGQVGHLLL
jgi:hypothetical protein